MEKTELTQEMAIKFIYIGMDTFSRAISANAYTSLKGLMVYMHGEPESLIDLMLYALNGDKECGTKLQDYLSENNDLQQYIVNKWFGNISKEFESKKA